MGVLATILRFLRRFRRRVRVLPGVDEDCAKTWRGERSDDLFLRSPSSLSEISWGRRKGGGGEDENEDEDDIASTTVLYPEVVS